jgi:hypothetical protein
MPSRGSRALVSLLPFLALLLFALGQRRPVALAQVGDGGLSGVADSGVFAVDAGAFGIADAGTDAGAGAGVAVYPDAGSAGGVPTTTAPNGGVLVPYCAPWPTCRSQSTLPTCAPWPSCAGGGVSGSSGGADGGTSGDGGSSDAGF